MLKNRWKKRLRIVAWIIGCLLGVLLTINFFAANYYRPLIEQKLMQQVKASTGGLYHISFKHVRVNFILGRIRLKEVSLDPDDSVFSALAQQNKAPLVVYHIQVKEIFMSLNQFHRAVLEGLIHIDELKLTEPAFFVVNSLGEARKGSDQTDSQTRSDRTDVKKDSTQAHIKQAAKQDSTNLASEKHTSWIKKIEIASLKIVKGRIVYQRNELEPMSSFIFSGDEAELESKHLLLSTHDFKHTSLLSLLENLDYRLSIRNIHFLNSSGFYTCSLNELNISSSSNTIVANGLSIQPKLKLKSKGYDAVSHKSEYFTLSASKTILKNEDLFRALKTGRFSFPMVRVQSANLIYHALGHATKPASLVSTKPSPAHVLQKGKLHLMPQDFIKRLPKLFNLDSLEFNSSNFIYQEQDSLSGQVGEVSFNDSKGLVTHCSNDSASIQKNPDMAIFLQTNLYNEGLFKAAFHFDMTSKQDSFWYEGSLSNFNLRLANVILKPLAGLKAVRGVVKDLQFQAGGDSLAVQGTLTMRYNSLSLKMLVADTSLQVQKQTRLLSSLANTFVVLKDNPQQDAALRSAEIFKLRNPNRSFLSFFWKSLLSGIKPSIGLTPNRETILHNSFPKFHRFGAWRQNGKSDRVENRQQRKARRLVTREQHKETRKLRQERKQGHLQD